MQKFSESASAGGKRSVHQTGEFGRGVEPNVFFLFFSFLSAAKASFDLLSCFIYVEKVMG